MIEKIEYIYGINKNGKKMLIGAAVFSLDSNKMTRHEIYVGQIVSSDVSLNKYKSFANAVGVIYFPQCDTYAYLEATDKVLNWIDNDSVSDLLEAELANYRNDNFGSLNQNNSECLDMEDPFVELYDLPLRRSRCSER